MLAQGSQNRPASGETTTAVVAALLMITPARLGQLEKAGWFAKVGRDRYRLVEVVQGFIKYLRDDARRSSTTAAASRVQDARAVEIELRTAEKQKLFEARGHAAAAEAVDDVLGPLRPDLLAIPARLTADIALRRKFEDEIDNAFAAMGERANALAAKVAAGAPADAKRKATPARRHKTGMGRLIK
jgi:hypothetical protein